MTNIVPIRPMAEPIKTSDYATPYSFEEKMALDSILALADRLKPHARGSYVTHASRAHVVELLGSQMQECAKLMRKMK